MLGRISVLVALLGLICVASNTVLAQLSTAQIAEEALPAVVVIEAGDVQGSGCLIDKSGTILTCYHVVRGAKSALAKMQNGGYFPVQGLLGMNPDKDIAVLKIDGKELPYLTVGDSSTLAPGDKVVAIGSPRGLENSVSDGIVSAMRRVADCPDDLRKWLVDNGHKDDEVLIQFTAPVSHGNSGGPLMNANGQVIGIVALSEPHADNVYFAVPVNDAKQLLTNKTVMKFEEIDFTPLGAGRRRVGTGPKDLGLGAVTAKEVTWTIPKGGEPTFRPDPGLEVAAGSVQSAIRKGNSQMRQSKEMPKPGEYRVLTDGSVLFASQDAKAEVSISFKARSRRVAVLPIVNRSNLDYMGEATHEAIAGRLSKWSFEIVPDAEVGALVRQGQINIDAVVFGIGEPLSAENIMKLADRLNATYLVFAVVGASGQFAVLGGAGSLRVAVAVIMFDGRSGKPILTQSKDVERDTGVLTRTRSAYEKTVHAIVEQIFSSHFGIK